MENPSPPSDSYLIVHFLSSSCSHCIYIVTYSPRKKKSICFAKIKMTIAFHSSDLPSLDFCTVFYSQTHVIKQVLVEQYEEVEPQAHNVMSRKRC